MLCTHTQSMMLKIEVIYEASRWRRHRGSGFGVPSAGTIFM